MPFNNIKRTRETVNGPGKARVPPIHTTASATTNSANGVAQRGTMCAHNA